MVEWKQNLSRRSFLEQALLGSGAVLLPTGCALPTVQEERYASLLSEEQRQQIIATCFPVSVKHRYQIEGTPLQYELEPVEGTATLFSVRGDTAYFLTNHHVVNPPTPEDVLLNEWQFIYDTVRHEGVTIPASSLSLSYLSSEIRGEVLGVEVIFADGKGWQNEREDIAVLRLDSLQEEQRRPLSPPIFGDDRALDYGSSLFMAGRVGTSQLVAHGIYAGRFSFSGSDVFLCDASVLSGFSGGGVFAVGRSGMELVGYARWVLEDSMTVVVPFSIIERWLEEEGLASSIL
ncbi:MAG: serine protease [Nanoarchaeota archaeon]|nr:serine protease [Nanoarchaeota archaeon]